MHLYERGDREWMMEQNIMDGLTDGSVGGWMARWMAGWLDGWVDFDSDFFSFTIKYQLSMEPFKLFLCWPWLACFPSPCHVMLSCCFLHWQGQTLSCSDTVAPQQHKMFLNLLICAWKRRNKQMDGWSSPQVCQVRQLLSPQPQCEPLVSEWEAFRVRNSIRYMHSKFLWHALGIYCYFST